VSKARAAVAAYKSSGSHRNESTIVSIFNPSVVAYG